MHWPLLLFLKSFSLSLFRLMQSLFFSIDRLCFVPISSVFFDFIEHERMEVILICTRPSLNKHYRKKTAQFERMNYIIFASCVDSSSFDFLFGYSSFLMFANCYTTFKRTFFFFRYKRRDWQADVGVLFWFFNRSVNFIQQNNDTGEYDSDVSIISFYGYRVWLVHINISYSMCFFLYKCMQWINLCRSRRMLNNDEY